MSFKYRKSPPKKQFVLSVVNKHTLHVKTNKMPTSDLNVVKKAIHVNDKRKSFPMARVDCRTLMTFEDKYTIEPVPQHVARIIQRTPDSLFDQTNYNANQKSGQLHQKSITRREANGFDEDLVIEVGQQSVKRERIGGT